jgi:ATP-dependent Lhr-like helicase
VNGHSNYFSSSFISGQRSKSTLNILQRTTIDKTFVSCTSTLELGIDIGTVDEVVQIDATHSIASLIQRVGRSGRKEGAK